MKMTVYIDPGHGGKDPGNVNFGIREKDTNLVIARRVKHYIPLLSAGTVNAQLTRNRDEFIDVDSRAAYLSVVGAHVVVSLHTDSIWPPQFAQGATALYDKRTDSVIGRKVGNRVLRYLEELGMRNRGDRTQRLAVLKTCQVSVLIEMGFASHKHDAALLNNAASQELIAIAIARGILEGLGQHCDTGRL